MDSEEDFRKKGPLTGRKFGNRGLGRPKGSQNKITKSVREAILAAFDEVGGEAWLVDQARQNPTAFLGLLAKIIPTKLDHEVNSKMTTMFVFRIHRPGEDQNLSDLD